MTKPRDPEVDVGHIKKYIDDNENVVWTKLNCLIGKMYY